jgi:2-keto-4-pentenoate hydratase
MTSSSIRDLPPTSNASAFTSAKTAETIWRLWLAGETTRDLPADLKPATARAGYDAQAELDRLSGNTRVGWKIAATSAAGQKHIAVDGPIVGRIFSAHLLKPGATTSIATNRMRVVEPEFAFRFETTLTPRNQPYTQAEALHAVSSLHLAFELPDSRFEPFTAVGGPTLIADNACAHELVLGPAVAIDWRTLDLSRHAVTAHVAGRYDRAGSGANVLGDPRIALTWFVNELARLGQPIEAGEFVTTGTCMVPLEVIEGDHVSADFGVLGTLNVRIAEAGT